MIFVTVGTERFPFNRLIQTLDEAKARGIITQEIFAQVGASTYKPKNFEYTNLIDFKGMIAGMQRAEVVVAHAGVGSVLLSMQIGKTPIVFPRRCEYGEHLDNHQVEFSRRMGDLGRVIMAEREDDLVEKIVNYKTILSHLPRRSEASQAELPVYLRTYVNQMLD